MSAQTFRTTSGRQKKMKRKHKQPRTWREKKVCAMVGCPHNAGTCPSQQFFGFPSENEPARRQLWITLSGKAKHLRSDGSHWVPGRSTKLCACHFEGGLKTNEPKLKLKVESGWSKTIIQATSTLPITQSTSTPIKRYGNSQVKVCKAERQESSPCKPRASADHSYVSLRQPVSVSHPVREGHKNKPTQANLPLLEDSGGCGETGSDNTPVHSMYCYVDGNGIEIQTSFLRDPCGNVKEAKERIIRLASLQAKPRGFLGLNGKKETMEKIHDLTGISPDVYFFLFSLLPQKTSGMSKENCLLLFLLKMRHGLSFACLGVIFSRSRTTALRNFQLVLENLCQATRDWIIWPTADTVLATLPSGFSENLHARCVLDCLEFKTEKPAILKEHVLLYSPTQGTCTCKVLVVSSPNGLISFLSRVYTGSATDTQIAVESGVLDMLESNDEIIVNTGFSDLPKHVTGSRTVVYAPPLGLPNRQFKAGGITAAYDVSSLRHRVERVAQRIRMFSILSVAYPCELLPWVDDVVHMCAVLANLQNP